MQSADEPGGGGLAPLSHQQIDDGAPEEGGVTETGRKVRPPTLTQATGDRGTGVLGLAAEPPRAALQQPRPAKLAAGPQRGHHPRQIGIGGDDDAAGVQTGRAVLQHLQ
jgi:hypothetical protein